MIADERRIAPGVAAALRDYAQAMRAEFGDRLVRLRLFGSFARGEAHEDSDVDIAVVLRGVDSATWRRVVDLATDAGLAHDVLLSPTLFDVEKYERWRRQERALVLDIERQGIEL